MKIVIDREKCRGHRNCTALAPDVFDLDEAFKAVVIDPRGNSDPEIVRAAESCPTRAVILEEESTGKRIFPTSG